MIRIWDCVGRGCLGLVGSLYTGIGKRPALPACLMGLSLSWGWAACSATAVSAPQTEPAAQAQAQVVGQSDRLWVVRSAEGDTLAGLAQRFLGSAESAWQIAESNTLPASAHSAALPLSPARLLIIRREVATPNGFGPDGYQTVPILAYHRFGTPGSKLVVTPEAFEAQLQTLAGQGATVWPLAALHSFLAGRAALPAKSVVITVDDGHETFYRLVFPLLKKYAVPVTLFVPTDAIGKGDALNWTQLQEMAASGWVSVQAHGKTHRSLIERAPRESSRTRRRALEVEVQTPRKLIEQRLLSAGNGTIDVTVRHLAYPYGLADTAVLDTMERNAFDLGLSMEPGGNAFYTHPHLLRRTMVLGGSSLDAFIASLQWRKGLPP